MRVAIIGAGPAGSFCAIRLLEGARAAGRDVQVAIYDSKYFARLGPAGCNLCAGVITHSMIEDLERAGMPIPPWIVQRRIDGFFFYSEGGMRELHRGPGQTFYSVFRGGGPIDYMEAHRESFDFWLLQHAVHRGATHVDRGVKEIVIPPGRDDPLVVVGEGDHREEADVVVGAFGVNSALADRFRRLGFGYRPPRTVQVCQAEFHLADDFIDRTYRGAIKVFSFRLPGVRFLAITPKRGYVTVTGIGREVTRVDLESALADPRVRDHFPPGWAPPPRYCYCHPRLPLTPARHPYADRIVVIGDAHVSRFYKNGIGSAFHTASLAADTILHHGVDREAFRRHYYLPCRRRYYADNRYGRLLFRLNDVISRNRFLSSVHLSVAAQGSKGLGGRAHLIDEVLWSLFTGDLPYRAILRKALTPGLQWRLAWETLRRLVGGDSVRGE